MSGLNHANSAQPLLLQELAKGAEEIGKDTGHLASPSQKTARPGVEQMYIEETGTEANDSFKVQTGAT